MNEENVVFTIGELKDVVEKLVSLEQLIKAYGNEEILNSQQFDDLNDLIYVLDNTIGGDQS